MASKTDFYVITGIQDGLLNEPKDVKDPLRQVGIRMDIDDWFVSKETIHANQRALFFPAMKMFCDASPDKKLSFFQIAGIHGQPATTPWDEPDRQKPGSYCAHGNVTFPTWHRPYMLLFEQAIYSYMKDYIKSFPEADRGDLLSAAQAWRLPYWDWAGKKPDDYANPKVWDYNLPQAFLKPKVVIRLPAGSKNPVPGKDGTGQFDNALYQFNMPNGIRMGDQGKLGTMIIRPGFVTLDRRTGLGATVPYDMCKATSRHPQTNISDDWINGNQDNDALVQTLRDYKFDPDDAKNDPRRGNLTASLRDAFYRIFTIQNYLEFSCNPPSRDFRQDMPFDSVEDIHNNMHVWAGGSAPRAQQLSNGRYSYLQGHMSDPAVAAFDPLFWFHHNNIDRMWAIWQLLWKDSWFTSWTEPGRNNPRTWKVTDDLRPFHKNANGQYWTSDDCRQTTELGYTYAGLEKWKYAKNGVYDYAAHRKAVIQMLSSYNGARAAAQKAFLSPDPTQGGSMRLMSMAAMVKSAAPELKAAAVAVAEPAPQIAMMAAAPAEPAPAAAESVPAPEPASVLPDLTIDDYVVNVIYERLALGGRPFSTTIFIGAIPEDNPFSWTDNTGTLVGEVYNFVSEPTVTNEAGETVHQGCDNCAAQQANHLRATGRVALTNALITRFKQAIPHSGGHGGVDEPSVLASMAPRDVVAFLSRHLHWRVTSDGVTVPFEQIPSVKVSLAVGKADHFADPSKLSTFYGYKGAFQVTEGRPGGASRADGLYPPGAEWVDE